MSAQNARMLMDTVKISGPPAVVAHFRKHVELAFEAAARADMLQEQVQDAAWLRRQLSYVERAGAREGR
jgi:hypothetical protein